MPLQLYDKDRILDACLRLFAQEGYDNASTAMLAEAAGVSKALIFHHFNSKKELYLSIIERSFERGRAVLDIDAVPDSQDFFIAREQFSIRKFRLMQNNPELYKVLIEAFFATPAEVEAEIEEKYGVLMAERRRLWRELFEKAPLRDGVDRDQAFDLIMITLDHFDKKYLSQFLAPDSLDEALLQRFLEERNAYLDMIRYGIEE